MKDKGKCLTGFMGSIQLAACKSVRIVSRIQERIYFFPKHPKSQANIWILWIFEDIATDIATGVFACAAKKEKRGKEERTYSRLAL